MHDGKGHDGEFTFPAKRRIKRQADFDAAFKSGRVLSDEVLVVHLVRKEHGDVRLGLSISKRVGNSPVRNRWKRLIREAFRLNRAQLPVGIDVVIRPRKGAQPDFHAIVHSLVQLCQRGARPSRSR